MTARQPSSPPTVLFMGRIFEVPWGGVRQMADSLLRAAAPLCQEQGRRIEVLVPRPGLCPVHHPAIREVVLPRFGGRRIPWDHWTVPQYANSRRNAVLYNIKLVLPERLRIPGFTSIHDLMYFPQPEKYHWREYLLGDSLYMRLMIARTVRRAHRTHVDSAHTAADARDLFPDQAPERFVPIPLGVDTAQWAPGEPRPGDEAEWQALAERGVEAPYVFYAGGLSERKNVKVLAAAFARFQRRHPEFRLVITGGSKPTMGQRGLERALRTIAPGALVRLGTVSDRGLQLLYQRAAFFVFPSLYEGFGLPALEAQAAGCPLICSQATSLPEAAGQAALYFDPRSPAQLLARTEELIESPALRAQLAQAGTAHAATMSWERTARRWLELVDEVHALGPPR